MSSVCSSLRMRFSTRCLYHGIYGSFGHQTDEILEELLFIAFVMWKVIEKMTIVNRKFDMYMVSRFDWSISILFSLAGTYASIDVNRGSWVIESKLCIFFIFSFFEFKNWILNLFLNFLIFLIFVTSAPGWVYAPIWEMGVSLALYSSLLPSLGFWVD